MFITVMLLLATLLVNFGVFAFFGWLFATIWNAAHLTSQNNLQWWQGSLVAVLIYLMGRLFFGNK